MSWAGSACNDCSNNFQEYSDASTNSSEEIGGQTCHQCRRNERDVVIWCLRCDRRGYCSNCISKWLVYFRNCYFSHGPPTFWGRCVLPSSSLWGPLLISYRYLDIPLEEIQKICPACRGICNCRVCLRGGNLIKVYLNWRDFKLLSYWESLPLECRYNSAELGL